MDVAVSEIVVEAVADEYGAEVEEKPEFLVRDFQMDGRVAAGGVVEVAF